MKLTVGQSLHSVVGATSVIVVRSPDAEVDVTCGGLPMVAEKPEAPSSAPVDGHAEPALVGKRYAHEELGLELLCTKPGVGTLAADGVPLPVKSAKPLPASD